MEKWSERQVYKLADKKRSREKRRSGQTETRNQREDKGWRWSGK